MADKQSREDKLTTLECMECGYREVFTEQQFKTTDGLSCFVCNGPTRPTLTRPGAAIRNRRVKISSYAGGTDNHPGGIAMVGGVDLASGKDFSVSIKGLKAIQREARKATAALKELDNIKKHTCPSCGKVSLDVTILRTDDEIVCVKKECHDCGWAG